MLYRQTHTLNPRSDSGPRLPRSRIQPRGEGDNRQIKVERVTCEFRAFMGFSDRDIKSPEPKKETFNLVTLFLILFRIYSHKIFTDS